MRGRYQPVQNTVHFALITMFLFKISSQRTERHAYASINGALTCLNNGTCCVCYPHHIDIRSEAFDRNSMLLRMHASGIGLHRCRSKTHVSPVRATLNLHLIAASMAAIETHVINNGDHYGTFVPAHLAFLDMRVPKPARHGQCHQPVQ